MRDPGVTGGMTRSGPSPLPRSRASIARALQALWNMRVLGLFLVAPVLGVVLADAIFGLPGNIRLAATVMFLVSLSMLGLLVQAEYRRLARAGANPGARP